VRVFIGLETLMPYTFYKGALLTNEEYERVKDELDRKEQEYLKLLLGEELESKGGPGEDSEDSGEVSLREVSEVSAEVSEESVDFVDSQKAHPSAEGGETADSGEFEVKPARRKRQK
jgi:hypothetical protein